MNLNKLFPRLSIRSKLIVAFVLLALVPLLAVAVFAARTTEHYVRALAIETLEHDLELAQKQTERSLAEAERTVSYLAGDLLQPLFAGRARCDNTAETAFHSPTPCDAYRRRPHANLRHPQAEGTQRRDD